MNNNLQISYYSLFHHFDYCLRQIELTISLFSGPWLPRFYVSSNQACDQISTDLQVIVISLRTWRNVVKHTTIKEKR